MKNFYFVVTCQLTHPRVKKLTDKILDISDGAIELKFRSQPFLTFAQAVEKTRDDFSKKCKMMYGEGEFEIRQITLINPDYTVSDELSNAFSIDENKSWVSDWEDRCAATIFYTEHVEGEPTPPQWMIKYEIYVLADEMSVNGEGAFSPEKLSSIFSSQIN